MKISIIIPVFNEEDIVLKTLETINKYMDKHYKNKWELIIIDDCSTDKSYMKALSYIQPIGSKKQNKIKLFTNLKNQGKGFSVFRGLMKSEGDYFLTLDCDLSNHINQLPKLFKYKDRFDFVIGSRYLKSSTIKKRQTILRIIYSRVFNILIRILFDLDIRDSQNGFKLMNRSVRNLILSHSQIKGFSFDVEHLLIAKIYGLKIKECPIIWKDNKPQKIKFKQIRSMFRDLIKIKKLQGLGVYE